MKKVLIIILSFVILINTFPRAIKIYAKDISPYSYSQKSKTVTYEQSEYIFPSGENNYLGLKYKFHVVCTVLYNDNTCEISRKIGPTVVIDYAIVNTSLAHDYFFEPSSANGIISSDKSKATFKWTIPIYTQVLGKKYYYKTISGSTTIKV